MNVNGACVRTEGLEEETYLTRLHARGVLLVHLNGHGRLVVVGLLLLCKIREWCCRFWRSWSEEIELERSFLKLISPLN